MDAVRPYIRLLVPLVILDLGLRFFAFLDVLKHERLKGARWMWGMIVLLVGLVGPILYFVLGRED